MDSIGICVGAYNSSDSLSSLWPDNASIAVFDSYRPP